MRLSVYRYEDGKIMTLIQQKEVVGLAGYIKKKIMEIKGIHKACDVLLRFKEIANRFAEAKDIHIFATASLRGIHNQDEALKIIQEDTGFLPEVLSGEEEARLGFIGASHFNEFENGILIDIGGASTELVRFENSQPVQLASIPVGCLNLYAKFVGKVIPTGKESKKIKTEIRERFDAVDWDFEEKFPLMVGVGGTARAVQKLSRDLYSLPDNAMIFEMSYLPHFVADADWIRSGLSLGTIPPEVISAIVAFLRFLIGGAMRIDSNSGNCNSDTYSFPFTFANNISTALSAAGFILFDTI